MVRPRVINTAHFSDETLRHRQGLPGGLYWGVYLGDERAGSWKIDVWATGPEAFEPIRAYGDALRTRLRVRRRRLIRARRSSGLLPC